MALEKMIVSATRGTGDNSLEAHFPYEFYAKKNIYDIQTHVIHLVMPMGGQESGLFRYPKDGEKILVDTDGENYYLLGYLPSESEAVNNFLTNASAGASIGAFDIEQTALKNEDGMIFRYQQTGKDTPSTTDVTDRYSEIGFYRRKTQWKTKDRAYLDVEDTKETDASYSKRLVNAGLAKYSGDKTDADHIKGVTDIHDNWIPRDPEDDKTYSERLVSAGLAKTPSSETDADHIKRVTGIHDKYVVREISESQADYSKRLVAAGLTKEPSSETDADHIARISSIYLGWISRGSESDAIYSNRLVTAGIAKEPSSETDADHIARANKIYKNWIPRIDATTFPRIDQINIHSTGDIHTSANNHQRMKAKRIEILSNVDASDFTSDLKGDNRPFGDKGADISELLQGDIHIRGKRRIVLKAGSEIRLEVGRSTIVISDAGIILSSRKTHSDIHNSLDTILSVLPRDGITMFGQHLKLAAAYDWAIAENMGASIKGTAGIMRLEGKDIKASTISGVAYITNFITQTLAFIDNLTSMSVGTHDEGNVQSSKLPSHVGAGVGVAGILINVGIGLKYPSLAGDIMDPDSKIVKFAALAIQLTGTVLFAIETIFIDPEDKKAKDALALTGLIAEWGLLLPVFGAICAASVGPLMVHNNSVHWNNNGELTLVGSDINQISLQYKLANSPLGGFNPPQEDDTEEKWYDKVLDFVKAHKALFIGIGSVVGIGAAVGAGIPTWGRMNSLSKEKDSLETKLNEL